MLDWPEIESIGLGFYAKKSSLLDSVFVHGNRAQWTRFSNAVVRYFQQPREFKTNETQAPILTKPRRLKLHRFCIVVAAKASSFLHRRGGETRPISAFCITWSFRRLGLVRIGAWFSFVASFFFILNSLGCWKYLTTVLLNRVHWARFPWTKTESSRLDFFA